MAAKGPAEPMGQIHARYVGVAVQVALGANTMLTPSTAGTTYSFIESHFHISPTLIGLVFIVTGIVAGLTNNKWVYWVAGVGFFLLFSLFAFWGAVNHLVSFQAGIIYLGLAAYGFLAYPRNGQADGR